MNSHANQINNQTSFLDLSNDLLFYIANFLVTDSNINFTKQLRSILNLGMTNKNIHKQINTVFLPKLLQTSKKENLIFYQNLRNHINIFSTEYNHSINTTNDAFNAPIKKYETSRKNQAAKRNYYPWLNSDQHLINMLILLLTNPFITLILIFLVNEIITDAKLIKIIVELLLVNLNSNSSYQFFINCLNGYLFKISDESAKFIVDVLQFLIAKYEFNTELSTFSMFNKVAYKTNQKNYLKIF